MQHRRPGKIRRVLVLPVTKSRPSTLRAGLPASFQSRGDATKGSAPMTFTRFWPRVSSPYPSAWPIAGLAIFPSAALSAARSVFQRSAARSSSCSRAVAAAARSCGPIVGVVRLPNVPASQGVRSVSPITMRTDSSGTRSSSATCCASDVRMFCPISTLPVKAVTAPSETMCSHAPTSFGSSRAPPGRQFLRPARREPPGRSACRPRELRKRAGPRRTSGASR